MMLNVRTIKLSFRIPRFLRDEKSGGEEIVVIVKRVVSAFQILFSVRFFDLAALCSPAVTGRK
jgi:hypothetical protein